MSKSDDQLSAQGGQSVRAGSRAAESAGSGPASGLVTMVTAGAAAQTVSAAGTAARATAGTAGAPRTNGSAGQAGSAVAGAPSSQAAIGGAGGGAGSSGSAGTAGAGASSAAGAGATAPIDACPIPLPVVDGTPVDGAGCNQQWEGIVMTVGGRGLCTASFITDRHLISASHCYAGDGPVSLQVSAPTWDNGAKHTFQAQVKRSGSEMELDISIIDLGKSVDWATPARRFLLHAGTPAAAADLHLYGFGNNSSSGGAGMLRGVPKRATIHVTDTGKGTLTGMSADAQLCEGDSGGPALMEKTAAVLYGINQGADPPGNVGFGTCAAADWTIVFTNVSEYVSFVEKAIGTTCERKQVDGLDVAQCW
jgi:hypothetical protein